MTLRLVALHGFTGSPDSFRHVVEQLPADLPVVLPTLLGHDGTSGGSLAPGNGSFEAEVDRLCAMLSPSAAGQDYLLGYSMGARLGLGLLARHRRWFRGAVLIGVHPGLESPSERSARLAADEAWCQMLEERGLETFLGAWQALPLFTSQAALPGERRAEQHRQRLCHNPHGLACALRQLGLGRMPHYGRVLPELRLPIRLLVGSLDTKFCALARQMAELLPDATLVTVPEVGHNVVLEHPERVARAVIEGMAA